MNIRKTHRVPASLFTRQKFAEHRKISFPRPHNLKPVMTERSYDRPEVKLFSRRNRKRRENSREAIQANGMNHHIAQAGNNGISFTFNYSFPGMPLATAYVPVLYSRFHEKHEPRN
jgi:hypothetical protein